MKRFFILLLALLPELVAWIRRTAPQAQVIFHQTWAYSQTSTHQEFPNYDSDQITMYYAIQAGEHHRGGTRKGKTCRGRSRPRAASLRDISIIAGGIVYLLYD